MVARKRGGRSRSRLSRASIVEEALRLLDAEGLEAITFRRLAGELKVSPMALYRHVADKEDLLDATADRVLADMYLSIDRGEPWTEQLRQFLMSFLLALAAHPAAAPLFAERTTPSPRSVHALEVLLDVLRSAGFSPALAVDVMRHALTDVVAIVVMQPKSELRVGDRVEAEPEARQQLAGLRAEEFPRLTEAAPWLLTCNIDEYYRFGVDIFVAGTEVILREDQKRPQ